MKTIAAMILMFALYDASAVEVKVTRMSRESGYSERFELKTSMDEKVVLDCQSFIQGILVGPVGESAIMLQEWECEELMHDMKKSLQKLKAHCIEIDFERNVMDAQGTCL